MPAPNEITPPQLTRLIGLPDCPELVDVCTPEDFAEDPFLVPGAWRHDHQDMPGLIERLEGRMKGHGAIVICQKGRKLSQGVAAWLRSEGIDAQFLQGGMYAWRDTQGGVRVPATAIPHQSDAATLWVTRHRPKIDRIACPWLIRRFVDRRARFLFVSPGEVTAVAEKMGAIPFDIEGVEWTHAGDRCTFDMMLERFELSSPALDRLALVVRAADTNRHDLHPAAAGLLAISVGLSRRYRDDQDQLAAGLDLYDTLYRWARDGHDEGHAWPKAHG
ncbi:MAG: chromate resistance protein ChrB domain-containing protein, partial [Pseudomonadota bacterium]